MNPSPTVKRSKVGGLAGWALVILLALGLFGAWSAWREWNKAGDPQTIVSASLQALQEQNVLVPFAARYVAVVTSEQSRFGGTLAAKKTLIMPGTVRYEVDLAKVGPSDLEWNATTKELEITLPKLRVAGPEIDMDGISEFQDGAILLTLTDAENVLDRANQRAARAELLKQAQGETPMKLAKNAARSAVTQNFAMPLKAAGIDAGVTVRFKDDQ